MAFWLFLTAMDLLIPAIMVGIGTRFLKHPPKTIKKEIMTEREAV